MATRVDERVVTEAARALGADGLHFSDRQLWYAVCARLERPQVTEGLAQVVSGTLMIAIGVVFGILATVFVAALVPVGMVVLGMGVQSRRLERHRPTTRGLALSYDEFVREVLVPLRGSSSAREALTPLLPSDGLGDPPSLGIGVTEGIALVVCDRGETAALLEALAPAEAPTWRAVVEADATELTAGRRVHALHDADPRGCGLALRLAGAGAGEVVDIGLRPGELRGRHIQVIEGAPYLVPPTLSALLSPDEIVWLADGRRVEIAILSPRELVDGMRRVIAAPSRGTPGAAPPSLSLAGASLIVPVELPLPDPDAIGAEDPAG